MPTVRKDPGRDVTIRGYGRFEPGQTYDVDHETAEYLVGRGDFTLVKEDVTDVEHNDVNGDEPEDADLIEQGKCPWCDDYEGDHIGQHASSAHPDAWNAYTED